MHIASRSDWKNIPLPEQHASIPASREYSAEEMDLIRRGLIPQEMEDKWFIFSEGDSVYFHRSWTGLCVYVAHFEPTASGWRLSGAEASRQTDQYSCTDDAHDAQNLLSLIDVLLLHRPFEFEGEASLDNENFTSAWHLIGRATLGVHPNDSEPDR